MKALIAMSKDFSKIFSSLQHGLTTENDLVIENIKQKVWSDLRATLPHPLTSISQNFIETHSLQFDNVASSLIPDAEISFEPNTETKALL